MSDRPSQLPGIGGLLRHLLNPPSADGPPYTHTIATAVHDLSVIAAADGCGDPHLLLSCSCGWSIDFEQYEDGSTHVRVPWGDVEEAINDHLAAVASPPSFTMTTIDDPNA